MKARRKTLKISQEKLAELVDVSTQTINDIENRRSWVSDKTISRVAEALGVEVFQLFMPREGSEEDTETLVTALLRLRQDIKADLSACIGSRVDDHFSRFVRTGLPLGRDDAGGGNSRA